MAKDSFILYHSYYEYFKNLTVEQKGKLFDAIFLYEIEGKTIELEPILSMAFSFIKTHLDINKKKWTETCQKRSEAGKTGGLKSGEVRRSKRSKYLKNEANEAVTVTGTGTVSVSETVGKNKKFVPPTVEEVKQYCIERNNGINPERFVAHYASKGWMVGKNKMKDWKQAVITWELNNDQGLTKVEGLF